MKQLLTMHDIVGLLNILLISKIDFTRIYIPKFIYNKYINLFSKYDKTFQSINMNYQLHCVYVDLGYYDNRVVTKTVEKTIKILTFMGWEVNEEHGAKGLLNCSLKT